MLRISDVTRTNLVIAERVLIDDVLGPAHWYRRGSFRRREPITSKACVDFCPVRPWTSSGTPTSTFFVWVVPPKSFSNRRWTMKCQGLLFLVVARGPNNVFERLTVTW